MRQRDTGLRTGKINDLSGYRDIPDVLRYRARMADLVQETLEMIGATLRDARLGALLTQSEVGQRAGVSRQLVSRIEQGLNGEISAYVAVAAAVQHRFTVLQEPGLDEESTGLDFTSSRIPPLDE